MSEDFIFDLKIKLKDDPNVFEKLFTFTQTMDFDPFKYPISKLNDLDPQKGRVLISEPFMLDEYFKRSVVYLTELNEDGAVGFILNKVLDIDLNEILLDFPKLNSPVYLGGPVQPQNLFYLHKQGDIINDSIPIANGVYWNGNFEQLKAAIEKGLITESEVKFFLGYSGWDNVQLVGELKENSWIIQDIDTDLIFADSEEDLWKTLVRSSNPRISPMADFPEDPNLN